MIKLSQRLEKIAAWVPQGMRVADIGSDHALLPLYLIQSGVASAAIAGELNDGPFAAARKAVSQAGLSSQIQVRQGDGLAAIEAGEADCITIAGMGGALMANILEAGTRTGKLAGVDSLVLQPNVGEDAVRRWLVANGWFLQREQILEEDGKRYEILQAVSRQNGQELNRQLFDRKRVLHLSGVRDAADADWLLYTMGPWLISELDAVFVAKWRSEAANLRRICERLAQSELAEALEKRRRFEQQIMLIEEVLSCLPMDKPLYN